LKNESSLLKSFAQNSEEPYFVTRTSNLHPDEYHEVVKQPHPSRMQTSLSRLKEPGASPFFPSSFWQYLLDHPLRFYIAPAYRADSDPFETGCILLT